MMNYKTYAPHKDLASMVNFYWVLEVAPDENSSKQRIVPDGCIEMAFILGDDIKRYTSEEEYILQPRAMVLGQTMEPFYIQPTGYVHTFAVSFYPSGFAHFVTEPIQNLRNKETPISLLFGEQEAADLEKKIIEARDTGNRIRIIETFLISKLTNKNTIDQIVTSTIDILLSTKGKISINRVLNDDSSQRRQLERKFLSQIGISPKQLSKVIRMQWALKLLLNEEDESLTTIAYESEYYDQSHFIKDFREFTGVSPREFLGEKTMALSTLFYKGTSKNPES
jgi:AraC-like DNA-binding protein